jgi:protein tyrosine/serine phosphatase
MQKIARAIGLSLVLLTASVASRQNAFSTPRDGSAAGHAAASSAAFAEKLSVSGVPNAGKVSEQLFRGAQPHISELAELRNLGITTIVDLRSESSHTRDQERARARSLGMHFVSIPVGGFSNPSSAQLAQFFTLVRQTPQEKIFVHCRYGHDRTGVFIAAYRIAFEHWTANQALAEMNAFGFNHIFHPGMILFVRDLPNRLQSDPVLKGTFDK